MREPQNNTDSRTPELLHVYDGIQEYDNPLPRWWVWMFGITIVWSVLYFAIAILPPKVFSGQAILKAEEAAVTERLFGTLGELKPDDATILTYAQEEKWVQYGHNVFKSTCVTCHGEYGQGGTAGPNLTDNAYIHVKQPIDIFNVIKNGARNGDMPAHGAIMSDNELIMISAYVASLRNTNAPGGKAPEGEVAPDWKIPPPPQK